jgi:hypothetical protein
LWLKCFKLIWPECYPEDEVEREPEKKDSKNKTKPAAKKMPDSRSQQETREEKEEAEEKKEEEKQKEKKKRKITRDRPEEAASFKKKHKTIDAVQNPRTSSDEGSEKLSDIVNLVEDFEQEESSGSKFQGPEKAK